MATTTKLKLKVEIKNPYFIEESKDTFVCDICGCLEARLMIKRNYNVKFLSMKESYDSTEGLVCSEECFNLWLLGCQKN